MDGSETSEGEREQELLANLRDLIDEAGHGGAARQLGVDRKTLWRVLDSGRLTPRVTQALERRGANPEAARRRSRLDALERRTELLDKDVEGLAETVEALREEFRTLADLQAEALRAWERRLSAVESQLAGGTTRATEPPGAGGGDGAPSALQGLAQPATGRERVARPHRDHPEVVTLRAEEGEELVYGEAAPLIVEWRRQRIAHLDKGASGVEHARARVRMCELELLLVGKYELTLPPDTYPWDASRLREERDRCEQSLRRERRRLLRAHCLALPAPRAHARALAALSGGGSPVTARSRLRDALDRDGHDVGAVVATVAHIRGVVHERAERDLLFSGRGRQVVQVGEAGLDVLARQHRRELDLERAATGAGGYRKLP